MEYPDNYSYMEGIPLLTKYTNSCNKYTNEIWIKKRVEIEWKEAIVVSIHTKGDKPMFKNYRGISLIITTYKVFSNILQKRLEPYLKEVIGEK